MVVRGDSRESVAFDGGHVELVVGGKRQIWGDEEGNSNVLSQCESTVLAHIVLIYHWWIWWNKWPGTVSGMYIQEPCAVFNEVWTLFQYRVGFVRTLMEVKGPIQDAGNATISNPCHPNWL